MNLRALRRTSLDATRPRDAIAAALQLDDRDAVKREQQEIDITKFLNRLLCMPAGVRDTVCVLVAPSDLVYVVRYGPQAQLDVG